MSFFTTFILVLARKLLSNWTYLLEACSHKKTISEGKAILEKILENTPYTGIYDEFPEEEIESSLGQQKEAHTTESKFSSYSSSDPVAKEPPIQGTYHTSRDDEPHPFTCPFEFEDDLFLDADLGNTLEPPNSTSSHASNSEKTVQGGA